ncbi:MAG: acetyltransferase [Bacteroidales bacterium]
MNLILVGGGGHCKSVIDVAESAGYKILGILDILENIGKKVLGYSIIGTDENLSEYKDYALFIVSVGQISDASLRIKIHDKIIMAGGKLATIIASSAQVSRYCTIDSGTVIMHQAVINADAKIGVGCIINTFANIEHDTIIEDFCHISTGAMINGSCIIGKGTFIGSQAVIANGVCISNKCVISAGSFVRKNILQEGIYAGNPALFKKKL